ncbi:MAG TPA: serine hydrolase domain-containing protein [Blastocatellia bacterium]|jgi:CubicO group peptidase (beta-lactamase class C family)|nr:serine hydrolase domain-containing protein [Blastocatellia bacterium]
MKSKIYNLANVIAVIVLLLGDCRAQEVTSEIDKYLNIAVETGKFSGSILIARNGKVLVSRGYGMASRELNVPNTPQMKFRIGSLTKQFTAMAIMILQERGKLNVQDSVCKYMPDCPRGWAEITIHHLLTHTSGIQDLLSFPDFRQTMALPSPVAQTVERFKNKALDFKPGAKFKYSNSGYVLLGYIIERASGQSYEAYLKENIFEPLKMSNSGSDHNDLIIRNRAAGYTKRDGAIINAPYIDMSIPTGGGSLYSTVEDLFLWDQGLYTEKLITKKSLAAMFTPYAIADWGDGAAYGWFIGEDKSKHKYMGFLGGINGFAAQIMRYPDEKLLVVVLSNFSFAPVSDIESDLAGIVFSSKLR